MANFVKKVTPEYRSKIL